jgi:hypothetical protein
MRFPARSCRLISYLAARVDPALRLESRPCQQEVLQLGVDTWPGLVINHIHMLIQR